MPIDTIIALCVLLALGIIGFAAVWFTTTSAKSPNSVGSQNAVRERPIEISKERVIDLTQSKGLTRSETAYADTAHFSLH